VPAMPGCVTCGRNLEEAQALIKDAINGYIESLRKHRVVSGQSFSKDLQLRVRFERGAAVSGHLPVPCPDRRHVHSQRSEKKW